jgi:vacuolar-type H+-ATPase subunit E/Vma4
MCFCGSKALSVEERLIKVEQMLEHQEKIIRVQETTIKCHEKNNADLKMRLEVLENDMRKHRILTNTKEVTNDSVQNQRRDNVEENVINSHLDDKDMRAADDIQIASSSLNRIIKRKLHACVSCITKIIKWIF